MQLKKLGASVFVRIRPRVCICICVRAYGLHACVCMRMSSFACMHLCVSACVCAQKIKHLDVSRCERISASKTPLLFKDFRDMLYHTETIFLPVPSSLVTFFIYVHPLANECLFDRDWWFDILTHTPLPLLCESSLHSLLSRNTICCCCCFVVVVIHALCVFTCFWRNILLTVQVTVHHSYSIGV